MQRFSRWPFAAGALVLGFGLGLWWSGGAHAPHVFAQAQVAPRERDVASYRDVVKTVLPAVVSIEAKSKPRRAAQRRGDIEPQQLPFDGESYRPNVGFGSGFIVDAKGVVLTNYHVIEDAGSAEITLSDGRKFVSKEITGDRKTDLAIVRFDTRGANLPFLKLGNSDEMEVGDRVLAVGAPFGLAGSVTHGIVSAKSRNLKMNLYEDFLQTDAAINPGNSGGPLVNMYGEVIGINSAIKSRSGGFQGIGLAISSNLARGIMTQLLKDGVVKRGYLGVQIKDVTPEVADKLGVKAGVVVARVFDDSPASKGGLIAGDVVTAIAGKPIKDGRDLQRVVASLPVGEKAQVDVTRDGKTTTVTLTIEEQPDEFGARALPVIEAPERTSSEGVNVEAAGVVLIDLTPGLGRRLGFGNDLSGALITAVTTDSAADLAGLRAGTLIEKVAGEPVASAADAKAEFAKVNLKDGVTLRVRTPINGVDYVVLRTAE